jgi:hypothetical protein
MPRAAAPAPRKVKKPLHEAVRHVVADGKSQRGRHVAVVVAFQRAKFVGKERS